MSWWRRFLVRGVFWRQFLHWAVVNVPYWMEPIVIGLWSLVFLLWGPGRRGVMQNLKAIKPGSSSFTNFFRTFVVFWNYAWTITDNARFRELRVSPDWEFEGMEYFEQLQNRTGGAIILTAHMGSYDLGAHLFAETSRHRIVMVRAPELDPQTREYEEHLRDRTVGEALKVDFSTRAGELALDLLQAIQRGEIIAIQGDRVTPGISYAPATLFGRPTRLPTGPFALAMASRVPIFPMFIMRLGRRRYRLVAAKPIEVIRTRDRNAVFEQAMKEWSANLEEVIRAGWFQWFTFDPYEVAA